MTKSKQGLLDSKLAELPESRLPNRIAWLLAAIVFPLIWVGGLVTTYDAGMAVPDWPNTYNYNMFAYPIRDWFFGPWDLFVEHGHRLLGSLAGIVAIGLLIVTIRKESRTWVKWMAFGLLALVIAQGLLGGARVLLNERFLAKAHGCLGPAFFATVVGFLVVTSRGWKTRFNKLASDNENTDCFHLGSSATFLKRCSATLLVVSYLQLVIGAFLRHIHVEATPSTYLGLVALHITTALLIVLGTAIHWVVSRRRKFAGLKLRRSANMLALLVLVQFCLGIGTWVVKYGWPVWFENWAATAGFVVMEKSFLQMNLVTAHVAVGSLILAFWTVNMLHCHRSLQQIERSPPQTDSTDQSDSTRTANSARSGNSNSTDNTTDTISTHPVGA